MRKLPFPVSGAENCDEMFLLRIMFALKATRDPDCAEFYREVTRAELEREISEFQAIYLQAILEISQGCESADESLGMAEVVASTFEERDLLRRCRASHEWLQQHPSSVSGCSQAAMGHEGHIELSPALFIKLCTAYSRGDAIMDIADMHAA